MQYDYNGKDVYVGIDVHKKSYSVYCICNREKIKSWSTVFAIRRVWRTSPSGSTLATSLLNTQTSEQVNALSRDYESANLVIS